MQDFISVGTQVECKFLWLKLLLPTSVFAVLNIVEFHYSFMDSLLAFVPSLVLMLFLLGYVKVLWKRQIVDLQEEDKFSSTSM